MSRLPLTLVLIAGALEAQTIRGIPTESEPSSSCMTCIRWNFKVTDQTGVERVCDIRLTGNPTMRWNCGHQALC